MDALVNLIVLGLAVRVVVSAAGSVLPIGRWRALLIPRSPDPRRLAECMAELSRVAAQIAVLKREGAQAEQKLMVASVDDPHSPVAKMRRDRLTQIGAFLNERRAEQRKLGEERRALQPSAGAGRAWMIKLLACDFCHHFWAAVLVVCTIGDGRPLTVLAAAGAGYLVPARLRVEPPARGCASGSCGRKTAA